jgi:hypothetical protein
MDKALILAYKVQRKIRRELRTRFTPALTAWDQRCLNTALRDKKAKGLLLDFGLQNGRTGYHRMRLMLLLKKRNMLEVINLICLAVAW